MKFHGESVRDMPIDILANPTSISSLIQNGDHTKKSCQLTTLPRKHTVIIHHYSKTIVAMTSKFSSMLDAQVSKISRLYLY